MAYPILNTNINSTTTTTTNTTAIIPSTSVQLILESLEFNDIFLLILSYFPDSNLPLLLRVCRRWYIMVRSYAECALSLDDTTLHYDLNWREGKVTVEFWLNVDQKHDSTLFCASKGKDRRRDEFRESRFQAHVPWSDGHITWDYGGYRSSYINSRLTAPFRDDYYGKWNHFAFVSTGGAHNESPLTAIYVNCRCVAQSNRSDSPTEMTEFTIGRKAMWDSSPEFVKGAKIRNLRIWCCVRTESQIKKYHKANELPKKLLSKLVLWLPLSSCLNKDALKDRSPNKVVLKQYNNVKWEKVYFRNLMSEKLEIPTPNIYLHFERGTLRFSSIPPFIFEDRPITVDFFILVNDSHDHVLFTFGVDNNHSRFQAHVPWSNRKVTFDYGGHDPQVQYLSNGRVETYYTEFSSWTHVALVCEGKSTRSLIYLNGVEKVIRENCDIPNEKNYLGPLFVGSDGSKNSSFFFRGGLWRFRVWERALTPEEVKKAATGVEVSREALRIYLPLEEGSGKPKNECSKEEAQMEGDIEWKNTASSTK